LQITIILAMAMLSAMVFAACQYTSSTNRMPAVIRTSTSSITMMPTERPLEITRASPMPTEAIATTLEKNIENTPTSLRSTPTTGKLPDMPFQPLSRTQYTFFILPYFEEHRLKVSQTVTYVNRSSDSLTDLLFIIEPNRQSGIFQLDELTWVNGSPIVGYTLAGEELRIALPELLLPGKSISLSMNYQLHLPEQPGPFGYATRQINLGDWYPFIPPFQSSDGWQVYEPALVGEHLMYDIADYEVNIREHDNEHEYIIAASALATSQDGWKHYYLPAARNFTLSASRYYEVLNQSIGSVHVAAFVFPEYLAAGKIVLQTTAQALELYSQIFAPYPHDSLTVVQAEFKDGKEYDGFYFLDEQLFASYSGNPRSYLTSIAAHETAHQWWYALVSNNQPIEPWLDEALATYSELLFYEKYYPDLIDWWWDYRVLRFEPTGGVDSTIYDFETFRSYVDSVYLRGALFLEELRNLIGDENFLLFLQNYAKQYSRKQVTTIDFFDFLAKNNSLSIEPMLSHYFLRTKS
jgi:hypothetical protein